MISVNDFKTGLTIEVDGDIWRVMDFQHVKPGKGAACPFQIAEFADGGHSGKRSVQVKSGAGTNRQSQDAIFVCSGDSYVFMDTENYEQVELSSKQIEYELNFLKENMEST